MDYLDSIDCSLEDFQAMLGKPFGIDHDALEVSFSLTNNMSTTLVSSTNMAH